MANRQDEKKRLSPKTKGTDQIPIVGREDKGELLRLLGRQGALLDELDDVIEAGQPLSAGTASPNMDTDYLLREARRQAAFQGEFGEAYNRDYKEVDSTDPRALHAAETRNKVTIVTLELPEAEDAAAGPVLAVRRETEVLAHPVDKDATEKIRINVPATPVVAETAEEQEVERGEVVNAALRRQGR
jgi:hypothetical protein